MIKVVEEDETWLIVDKPSGISVHNDKDSVIDFFNSKGTKLTPVHRIDKDTSGLLLLSKKKESTSTLQEDLSKSRKYYLAICRGQFTKDSGVWTERVSDKAEGYKNPRGKSSERKDCTTHWKKLYQNKFFTLVLFRIETGRTHQIRKHCAIHKNEIIGDKRYGDSKYQKMISKKYNFNKMTLHSFQLDIQINKKDMSIKTEIPNYFDSLLGEAVEKFL